MKSEPREFTSLKRASHPIRQDKTSLWDAHNIRLSSRDEDTTLSITTEKGTQSLYTFQADDEYIGHTVMGDYLIVMLKNRQDKILRINMKDLSYVTLYRGNLNFDVNYPAEIITSFEAELLNKIYWVDGKNRPRVMNITKPELLEVQSSTDYTNIYNEAPFDFVQDLMLQESIEVTPQFDSVGLFPAGVVQYALTYLYKYGQETNIFYTSPLLYTTLKDRALSPEETVSMAFNINMQGLETKFDYVRVYQIIRTSLNTIPTVKRIADLEIKDSSISFTDNNTTGDIVDSNMLLFLGGKDIIAGCICSQDNTLFLGDITRQIPTFRNSGVTGGSVSQGYRTINECNYNQPSAIYYYENQLTYKENTTSFKKGQYYRLGLQFQYKTGEWSNPVYFGDIKTLNGAYINADGKLELPIFRHIISQSQKLLQKGFRRVRPLVVLPDFKDMDVLAQGILCPTVFNAGSRQNNSPFAQSSWLLRPSLSLDVYDGCLTSDGKILPNDILNYSQNNKYPDKGAMVEYRHLMPLLSGFDRGAEIQNSFIYTDGNDDSNTQWVKEDNDFPNLLQTAAQDLRDEGSSYKSLYYVDQSILTMHSPDIEFNESIKAAIKSNSNCKVRIVKAIPFNTSAGNIIMSESSVALDPEAQGHIPKPIINIYSGARQLISGLFYADSCVDEKTDSKEFQPKGYITGWLTYLWHRTGSLNNDCARPESTGNRSAVLQSKIISNIKYASCVENATNKDILQYIDSLDTNAQKDLQLDNSLIQIFDYDDVTMLKIPDINNTKGDAIYFGNVDTLNPSYEKFRLVCGSQQVKRLTDSLFNLTDNTDVTFKIPEGSTTQKITIQVGEISSLGEVRFKGTVTNNNHNLITIESKTLNISGASIEGLLIVHSNNQFEGTMYIREGLSEGSQGNLYYGEVQISGTVTDEFKQAVFFTDFFGGITDTYKDFQFSAPLGSVDKGDATKGIYEVGDYSEALKFPREGVRIRYKTTPHAVFALNYKNNNKFRESLPYLFKGYTCKASKEGLYWTNETSTKTDINIKGLGCDVPKEETAYLYLAEITQEVDEDKRFGGNTSEALQNNTWIVAGPSVKLSTLDTGTEVQWLWGDTWYQRYDCLKTYPFSSDDVNQVVEIGSFMCETRINIDGRYDRNRGLTDNSYINKNNFNLINPVYTQRNNFFSYNILDDDYYKINHYSSQYLWTLTKNNGAINDAWTNLHLANTEDLDNTKGKIVSIVSFNSLLMAFQEKAISQILFNSRVQISTSDNNPIEITNSGKVTGSRTYTSNVGCQDKFNIVTTPSGIYFIDNYIKTLYRITTESLDNVGLNIGGLYWFRDNCQDETWRFKSTLNKKPGVRLYYDPKYQDIYCTPSYIEGNINPENEVLCYSESLDGFTSLFSYNGAVMFPYESRFFSLAYNEEGVLTLWENFVNNNCCKIFNISRDWNFSFIANDNPTVNKTFNNIEFLSDTYDLETNTLWYTGDYLRRNPSQYTYHKPFDYIRITNEYQDSGEVLFNDRTLRKKFRVWKGIIPRDKRKRIRNTWAKITLGCKAIREMPYTIIHTIGFNYNV